MKRKITTVSFDSDGTLVTTAFADLIWLEVLPQLVSDCWKISLDDAKQKLYADYESIGPERAEWYDLPYWLKRYRLDVNPKTLVQQYKSAVTLYPEVVDVLEKLSKKYELVVISNSSRLFLEITTDSLKPYFHHTISTLSDLGLMKGTDSYVAVCERIGIMPRQMVHIGDSLELDYVRAKRAGLKAFYLDRKGRRRGRYFVKDLKEFAMRLR
jgi:putative hydrolase of the HAD superfamily